MSLFLRISLRSTGNSGYAHACTAAADARVVSRLCGLSLTANSCENLVVEWRQLCARRPACYTSIVVALQLWAGGVVHRVLYQQPMCSPAASTPSRFVALALLVPLHEELIYRGALLLLFANRLAASPRACVALPALFFAAMHVNSSHFEASKFIHHFAFGCCVGARALVSGSALHAALIHVANNALVLCAHAEATYGGISLAPATAAYFVCACVDLLLLSKCQHAASTCK